jgi:hypothetical protein
VLINISCHIRGFLKTLHDILFEEFRNVTQISVLFQKSEIEI